MPHLSELARRYEGKVHFLAVSDEKVETVEKFLRQKPKGEDHTWAEAMAYTVATDPDGSVKKDIFLAAGQRGIPASFIIARGKVMWIGHPLSLDEPLAQVVAGTYDVEAAKQAYAQRQALRRTTEELGRRVRKANESGEWEPVLAFLDQALEEFPDSLDLALQKWEILLLRLHRDEEAYALGKRLVRRAWNDASVLNSIAWTVVDDPNVRTRDLAFALRAAERANELTESKNAAILDTLARVHYEDGRLDEAIRWQRRAVEHAEGRMKEELQATLDRYLAAKRERDAGSR